MFARFWNNKKQLFSYLHPDWKRLDDTVLVGFLQINHLILSRPVSSGLGFHDLIIIVVGLDEGYFLFLWILL